MIKPHPRHRRAGFLGSHLCERLVDSGQDVVCLDQPVHEPEEQHRAPARQAELRVRPPRHHAPDLARGGRDLQPRLPRLARSTTSTIPFKTTKTSACIGAINMLGLAKRRTGSKILQASTSEIYGDPSRSPAAARTYWGNVNTLGPRACYDEGKRCRGDALLRLPPLSTALDDASVARIFNTYGPPYASQYDGRVVSEFHHARRLTARTITHLWRRQADAVAFCYRRRPSIDAIGEA